jgi:hypothetical protein
MLGMLALALAAQNASSVADPQPDSVVAANQRFGRWNGEIRSYIHWDDDEPFFTKAECKLTNGSLSVTFALSTHDGQQPNPVIWVSKSEIQESAELEEIELTGLTIGSRVFQLRQTNWRTNGWFSNYPYRGNAIDVGGPAWFLAAREAASDPWLPAGLLLAEMIKVEKVELHYRAGEFVQAAPGNEPFGKVSYNVDGLKEGASWCLESLDSDVIKRLPEYIEVESPVLDEDALKELLSDVVATRPIAPDLQISHPDYEVFQSNGVYLSGKGSLQREGTFRVLHDTVCARLESDECRQIVRNADGTYTFYGDDGNGRSEVVTISPR